MDVNGPSHSLDEADAGAESRSVQVLEWLDKVAHIIVAVFFLVMAATVLVHTGLTLIRQLPLLAAAIPGISEGGPATQPDVIGGDPFFRTSLELLSSILFVVILLELLRTVITSLRTQDIQAVMREFL